jgi:hypothetical protein
MVVASPIRNYILWATTRVGKLSGLYFSSSSVLGPLRYQNDLSVHLIAMEVAMKQKIILKMNTFLLYSTSA